MLKDPTIRKSVYASIIAAILVIVLIQPILNFLGQFFIWLGENLYEGLSNSFYEEAARGLREKYSFILLFFFFGITSGTIAMATVRLASRNRVTDEKPKKRKSKIVLIILATILIIDGFYLLSLNFSGFQMNASFIQRMRIIKPLVDDKHYWQIDAKWAAMTNRKEYEEINTELNAIAEKNNITLPKALWD